MTSSLPQPSVVLEPPEGLQDAPEWAKTLFHGFNSLSTDLTNKLSNMEQSIASKIEQNLRTLYGDPEIISALPDVVETLRSDFDEDKLAQEERMKRLEDELDQMSTLNSKAANLLVYFDSKLDIAEGRQRRINIRLKAVPEGLEGSGPGKAAKLAQVILQEGLDIEGQLVDRAHRQVGQKARPPPSDPRAIVIRCTSEGAAEEILSKAFSSKGARFVWQDHTFWIEKDYSNGARYYRREFGALREVLLAHNVKSGLKGEGFRVWFPVDNHPERTEEVYFDDIFDATATLKRRGYDVDVVPRPDDLASQMEQLVWKVQGMPRVSRPIRSSQVQPPPRTDQPKVLEEGRQTRAKLYQPLQLRARRRPPSKKARDVPSPLPPPPSSLDRKKGRDNDPSLHSLAPPPAKEGNNSLDPIVNQELLNTDT